MRTAFARHAIPGIYLLLPFVPSSALPFVPSSALPFIPSSALPFVPAFFRPRACRAYLYCCRAYLYCCRAYLYWRLVCSQSQQSQLDHFFSCTARAPASLWVEQNMDVRLQTESSLRYHPSIINHAGPGPRAASSHYIVSQPCIHVSLRCSSS